MFIIIIITSKFVDIAMRYTIISCGIVAFCTEKVLTEIN